MERISRIQLAAQGSQREQFLLERGLRIYRQTTGRLREMAAGLVSYWKQLMDQGSLIDRERNYEQVKERLDWLEAQAEADPFAGDFWDEELESGEEELSVDFSEDDLEE